MPNVRIKDQTTDTALTTGDYVIVDSETEGTRKYDLGALAARVEALEQGGSGLTQAEKQLILTLFCKAAYAEDDAGVVYDALEAFWATTTRTITYNLSHVSSSNTTASVESGQSYTTTLTATGSYTLNTVAVTMGGVDITSTAYSSGTVSIPSVTGNIVITASAVLAAQSITATYTQSGTVYTTDSLDSLKNDLVVTANYAGGTSETVPASGYTLSGTLTAGTSTITVSYGGLTDTFTVTVTEYLNYYPIEVVGTGVVNTSGTVTANSSYNLTDFFNLDSSYSALTFTHDTASSVTCYVQFFNGETYVDRKGLSRTTDTTRQCDYSSLGTVTKARISYTPTTLTNVKVMKGLV